MNLVACSRGKIIMRIITGRYKGHTVRMPKGIRPTQNKVRKALFDIFGNLQGVSFLELFAGSGAVGLEALSKGAGDVVFVENNRDCLLAIRKNIEALKIDNCTVYPLEVDRAIILFARDGRRFDLIFLDPPYYKGAATLHLAGKVRQPDIKECRVSRLLGDVPLSAGTPDLKGKVGVLPSAATPGLRGRVGVPLSVGKKALQSLSHYDILAPNGFIVLQHCKKDILPEALGDLILFRQYRYGATILSVYAKG
jgi:16S rRNA (guanine(966)-N(2))-methyltransferase RsmD